MRDKAGWGQVVVGIISILLSLSIGWVALTNAQAETKVKIVQIENRMNKGEDYDAFLQEQVDSNKERIIITETTMKFLQQSSNEMNESLKTLVKEVQELNKNMAVLGAKNEEK